MIRRQYDKEFKQTIVSLLNSGQPMKSICNDYDLKEATVYRWKKDFKSETGVFKDEATLAYESEIRQLKKQLKDAQMERDILKKAVSIFSMKDK
jgi:transposase